MQVHDVEFCGQKKDEKFQLLKYIYTNTKAKICALGDKDRAVLRVISALHLIISQSIQRHAESGSTAMY